VGGDGGDGGAAAIDPLVISTRDWPIVLVAPGQSNVLFGAQQSGSRTTTGWVGENTGILVVENGSGVSMIENFSQLAALAPQGHDVIDASDPAFSQIDVWVDGDPSGPQHSGELVSLASLGITSISLSSSPVPETINGNQVTAIGSLTFADGEVEPVYDVTFGVAHTTDTGGAPEHSSTNADQVVSPASTGLHRLNFAADIPTTLAYSAADPAGTGAANPWWASNGQGGQGPPVGGGSPAFDPALFRNHMASAFPPEGFGHGGIHGSDPPMAAGGDNQLAQPVAHQSYK
jgi:hypothetical protein